MPEVVVAGGTDVAATDEVKVQPAQARGSPPEPMIRGANCYYLLTRAASEELRHEVTAGGCLGCPA